MTMPPVPDQLIVMTYLNQIRTHFTGQKLSVLHIEEDGGESTYAVEKSERQDDLETNIRYCAQKLQEEGLSLEPVGGTTKRDGGSTCNVVPPPRAKWQRGSDSGGEPLAPVAPPRSQHFSKSSFCRVKDADLVKKRRSQKRSGSMDDGSGSSVGRRPGVVVFSLVFQNKRLLFLCREMRDKTPSLQRRSQKSVSLTPKTV